MKITPESVLTITNHDIKGVYLNGRLQAGVAEVDTTEGYIKVWVRGSDHELVLDENGTVKTETLHGHITISFQ